jgi:hypothetical protein
MNLANINKENLLHGLSKLKFDSESYEKRTLREQGFVESGEVVIDGRLVKTYELDLDAFQRANNLTDDQVDDFLESLFDGEMEEEEDDEEEYYDDEY